MILVIAYEGALATSIAAEDAGSKQHSSRWGKFRGHLPFSQADLLMAKDGLFFTLEKAEPIRPVSFFHKTGRKFRFLNLRSGAGTSRVSACGGGAGGVGKFSHFHGIHQLAVFRPANRRTKIVRTRGHVLGVTFRLCQTGDADQENCKYQASSSDSLARRAPWLPLNRIGQQKSMQLLASGRRKFSQFGCRIFSRKTFLTTNLLAFRDCRQRNIPHHRSLCGRQGVRCETSLLRDKASAHGRFTMRKTILTISRFGVASRRQSTIAAAAQHNSGRKADARRRRQPSNSVTQRLMPGLSVGTAQLSRYEGAQSRRPRPLNRQLECRSGRTPRPAFAFSSLVGKVPDRKSTPWHGQRSQPETCHALVERPDRIDQRRDVRAADPTWAAAFAVSPPDPRR